MAAWGAVPRSRRQQNEQVGKGETVPILRTPGASRRANTRLQSKQAPEAARSETMGERKAQVLVVDDDRVLLRVVAEVLRRAGFEVTSVADSLEALAAITEPGLDVVMLDIRMPNVDGMEILRELKSRRPDVEVVMMTAFATVPAAVEALKAGAYDYLTKPFHDLDE
ncbi:MAG TPA: hypothetical protein DFS52_19915, partial [Myxococcales bacterium]|nr:hypothetical protein [Myxococcales bacterium]